jgi:AAA+ ATPase superfamily predicted ATPase
MKEMGMYFVTSGPVTGQAFYDRQAELTMLLEAIPDLRRGIPRYYAILGKRKIGKSSLLAEFKRQAAQEEVVIMRLDCQDLALDPLIFFQEYAIGLMDEFLIKSGHSARTGLLAGAGLDRAEFLLALGRVQALGIEALTRGAKGLLALPDAPRPARAVFQAIADLPNDLAAETGLPFVVILDEFQELRRLSAFKTTASTVGNIVKFFRARWQEHKHAAYFIAGSEISLLAQIIHAEEAPFFQHFVTLPLTEFAPAEARAMVADLFARSERHLDQDLTDKLITLANGHPFYLQVMGEELCRAATEQDIAPETFKVVAQETLFQPSGRLYLYFAGHYERVIGKAVTLERVLASVAQGHHTLSEIARDLRRGANEVSSWIGRLVKNDVLIRTETGYEFADPVFGAWIQGVKSPYKTIIGPYLIGDEAERTVAQRLGWLPILCLVQGPGAAITCYRLTDLVKVDGSYRVDEQTAGQRNLLTLLMAQPPD